MQLLGHRCARRRSNCTSCARKLSTAESLQTEVSSRAEQQRRLRHDLRGALSPAMLIADRLVSHADPAVKRSGDILLRSVERATEMLTEPSPPAGP